MSEVAIKEVVLAGVKRIQAATPFNPDFIAAARELNGKWLAGPKVWTFDARDEATVRQMCRNIYGTDGTEEHVELVTLRVQVGGEWGTGIDPDQAEIWLGGRVILRRPGRDAAVRLGEGVVKVEGKPFFQSGGSARYPAIGRRDGTSVVLHVRDVPRALAEQEVANNKGVSIVEEPAHE